MSWWSKKKSTDEGVSADRALALQDPRTRVHTTSAATLTTNTAVQNSTIIDNNKNTVTYRSTRQTVTHSQRAHVTEITTRRTPSQAELDELLAQLHINAGKAGSTTTTTTTSSKRLSPSSLNGVALRSTTSFKPNAEARRSSTLVKLEQTTMSQKQGRTVTQHVESKRVVLNPSKTSWPPKSTTTTTTSTGSSGTSSYKPYVSPFALKPIDSSYVSPYASKTSSITSSVLSKPTASQSVLSKPTVSSSGRSSIPSTTFATKPILSTPKTTVVKPFISLNPSNGAVPKRYPSITNSDAKCELKPTVSQNITIPKLKPVIKKKLKPAVVVIFNQEKFNNPNNEFRLGSSEDVKSLDKTFRALKCKVQIITDATLSELKNTVRKLEQKNMEDRSALVLVILSHGQRNESVAVKDGEIKIDDDVIFPILRNRTLHEKPKILFVQACKGYMKPGEFKTDAMQPHGSPSEILKCYSTYEGYLSYRLNTGTPFIQSLCDTLSSKPEVDIETNMKDVIRLVKSYTSDAQVPSVTSTMTTKYAFGDYV
ncbi:uncharacterized protein Damm [Drosophila montana]|uniref:uncharacterized protein Damm n=1 Tax=Drosophila montana TaxID=40370 RepID=UPI00313C3BD4